MDIILQLNNKKAPGKDGIKNIALKALPLNAITNITKIFNSCLQQNYFPQEWKHALITVIPKAGKDEKFPDNYRPISLISSLGKIFEKILLNHINNYCEENNIIPDFQHGFRSQTSTQHQLLRATNLIVNGFNNKTYTVGLFLDVKKAFDRMWHDGLIYKLILFKFPTYLIKIIHSYLDNRTFNVKLNNVLSSQRPILASTPQGSILSPALCNIYTSDFPTDNNMTVCLFADDAALLCTRNTVQEAMNLTQNYIYKLELWLTKWRIAINTDKTHAIVFRKLRSHNSPPPLQIFNSTIEWTFQRNWLPIITPPSPIIATKRSTRKTTFEISPHPPTVCLTTHPLSFRASETKRNPTSIIQRRYVSNLQLATSSIEFLSFPLPVSPRVELPPIHTPLLTVS
ncbi:RNA-directed DNA polymerase from mobile element jockey [Trichonephila clavipes]|nr:RNA-directed DNA polymerase from mobile element jockey [Trichonephila clavipes]